MKTTLLALALSLLPSLAHAAPVEQMSALDMLNVLDDHCGDSWCECASEMDINAVVDLGNGHLIVDTTIDGVRTDFALTVRGKVTERSLVNAMNRAFDAPADR